MYVSDYLLNEAEKKDWAFQKGCPVLILETYIVVAAVFSASGVILSGAS